MQRPEQLQRMPPQRQRSWAVCFGWLLMLAWAGAASAAPGAVLPTVFLPKSSFSADDLGVIVNDADPLSVEIATYYQRKRGIPSRNMIHVSFTPGATVMPRAEFARIKAAVDAKTPAQVQAYALTWTKPYRVDCMSITTAFAAGFDTKYCASGCALTKPDPYFNSTSRTPFQDFKLRPTMSLAGLNFEAVKQLIDRGVRSDSTYPAGTGYLLDTSDSNRNVHMPIYSQLVRYMNGVVQMERIKANYIEDKPDVLFYFTGVGQVDKLDSNRFVPGAIADHLTSAGGMLTDSFQMSSLRWLEAGATGSYGAVTEPCNFVEKFPNPGIVVSRYTQGETLIEAYWKSVAMPGQGIFIGEPLANPYGGYRAALNGGVLTLQTYALAPGGYTLLGADSGVGPYHVVAQHLQVGRGKQTLTLRNANDQFYSFVPETGGIAVAAPR